jgi:hypothetical protein
LDKKNTETKPWMGLPDEKTIKAQVYHMKLVACDAIGNTVVGDCPTRSYEGMAMVDEAVDNLLKVLYEEGVVTLNDEERQRILHKDRTED